MCGHCSLLYCHILPVRVWTPYLFNYPSNSQGPRADSSLLFTRLSKFSSYDLSSPGHVLLALDQPDASLMDPHQFLHILLELGRPGHTFPSLHSPLTPGTCSLQPSPCSLAIRNVTHVLSSHLLPIPAPRFQRDTNTP